MLFSIALLLLLVSSLFLTRWALCSATFVATITAGLLLGILWGYARCNELKRMQAQLQEWICAEGTIESCRPAALGNRAKVKLADISISSTRSHSLKYGRVKVYFDEKELDGFSPGDLIRFKGKIMRSKGRVLPGGYDFSMQNFMNKVDFYAYSTSAPELLKSGASSGFKSALMRFRQSYYKSISQRLKGDAADFASALIIGESHGISKGLMSDMRCAGISHVLCVSGLHLTLIAGIVFKLVRFLLNCFPIIALSLNVKPIAALLAWAASCAYWLLSGMNVATTRAFIMTSACMAATILNKRAYSFRTLAFAMLLTLLFNPIDILNVSFQLSFAAVFALVGSYNFLLSISNRVNSKLLRKVLVSILANLHSSVSISLVTAPISAYHFYTFSNYQILGNLLVLPIVAWLLMPLTLVCIVLLPFGASSWALELMAYGIKFVECVASGIASMPGSIFYTGYVNSTSVILCVLGASFLLLWKGVLSSFGVFLALTGLASYALQERPVLIFDAQTNSLGINDNGCLNIYSTRLSKFTLEYWSSWFGQKQVLNTRMDLSNCNLFLKLSAGKSVALLNSPNVCSLKGIDLVINNAPLPIKAVVNSAELVELGTVAVYFGKKSVHLVGTKGQKTFPIETSVP